MFFELSNAVALPHASCLLRPSLHAPRLSNTLPSGRHVLVWLTLCRRACGPSQELPTFEVPQKADEEVWVSSKWGQYNKTLLFDLEADPTETTDVSAVFPHILAELLELLFNMSKTVVQPSRYCASTTASEALAYSRFDMAGGIDFWLPLTGLNNCSSS